MVKNRTIWLLASAFVTLCVGLGMSVSAERYTSPSYTIDASVVGNSFGGASSSANYQLTSSGGESIIGQGAGGSYRLDSGYVAQLQNMMQLTVQPGGLKAYYPFDENTGTSARDSSSNTHDGILQTGAVWSPGKIGAGVITASNPVIVSDNTSLVSGETMTAELWVKQGGASANRAILTHWDYTGGNSTSAGWSLGTGVDSSRLRVFVGANTTDPGNNYIDTVSATFTADVWQHIVLVFDGSQTIAERVAIYINGQKSTMEPPVGTITSSLLDSSGALQIGDFVGLTGRKFNGTIDHVKLFNRVFTASEIKAEYDAQNAGIETGLSLGMIVPGVSGAAPYDAIVHTDGNNGYSLAINQNQNMTSGTDTIPSVSGTIASPVLWAEGTTKGLGFTIFSTNATAIPAKWSNGSSYAALPANATTFYSRAGVQSGGVKDYINMRLRLDAMSSQPSGNYSNIITTTATTNL